MDTDTSSRAAGIVGPVTLEGTRKYDLANMPWSYKIGLDGLDRGLYLESGNWKSGDNIPKKKPFTWYQRASDRF